MFSPRGCCRGSDGKALVRAEGGADVVGDYGRRPGSWRDARTDLQDALAGGRRAAGWAVSREPVGH